MSNKKPIKIYKNLPTVHYFLRQVSLLESQKIAIPTKNFIFSCLTSKLKDFISSPKIIKSNGFLYFLVHIFVTIMIDTLFRLTYKTAKDCDATNIFSCLTSKRKDFVNRPEMYKKPLYHPLRFASTPLMFDTSPGGERNFLSCFYLFSTPSAGVHFQGFQQLYLFVIFDEENFLKMLFCSFQCRCVGK